MIENDDGKGDEKKPVVTQPRFELEAYRKFIRDASPYISVIAGRRVKPTEAETMTNAQVTELALILDSRVKDLKKL
jgi:hypothetical protein